MMNVLAGETTNSLQLFFTNSDGDASYHLNLDRLLPWTEKLAARLMARPRRGLREQTMVDLFPFIKRMMDHIPDNRPSAAELLISLTD
jgi:hypothetical protein